MHMAIARKWQEKFQTGQWLGLKTVGFAAGSS
jgi:hypothetical protein